MFAEHILLRIHNGSETVAFNYIRELVEKIGNESLTPSFTRLPHARNNNGSTLGELLVRDCTPKFL